MPVLLLDGLRGGAIDRRADRNLGGAAHRIRDAVRATIASGVATADLGGLASTSEFTETVLARTLRR